MKTTLGRSKADATDTAFLLPKKLRAVCDSSTDIIVHDTDINNETGDVPQTLWPSERAVDLKRLGINYRGVSILETNFIKKPENEFLQHTINLPVQLVKIRKEELLY